MITAELAQALRISGVAWTPTSGDRFVIPNAEMANEQFVVADMAIEAVDVPGGNIIKFNGTTEWALDSVAAEEVLWLPREDQLRSLLGDDFARLETVVGGFVVVLVDGTRHADIDPERAYARAALATRERGATSST